ncbi:PAS domain-containing serine/threonine-protein kinase [Neolecta irregularis DAH-3]|uniref:PAS domain-containing serine/threonine-protein kinase n=1 Tax=Neolecta irregularis (strain DAH-3) TaxID=1198029 RepID=A0A1U7LQI6_NEOID|nr:PAS domain-containing serine/threonine-protein kinase [Neolecta irregularis DAH-3]|eukprot:OLL24917.1 PAS domain-containing serine/threonine-protein kinase [Neolecta irregularis DAH-3]
MSHLDSLPSPFIATPSHQSRFKKITVPRTPLSINTTHLNISATPSPMSPNPGLQSSTSSFESVSSVNSSPLASPCEAVRAQPPRLDLGACKALPPPTLSYFPVTPPCTPFTDNETAETTSLRHLRDHQLHPEFAARYSLRDELGTGGFGFVVSAIRLSDQIEVAVKFILRHKVPKHGWARDPIHGIVPVEAHVLGNVSHPNIIRMLDFYQDRQFFYLVMEIHGSPWVKNSNAKKLPGLIRKAFKKSPLRQNFNCGNIPSQRPATSLCVPTPRPGMIRRASHDLFECIETHKSFGERQTKYIFRQIVGAVAYLNALDIVHRDIKDENILIDENFTVKLIDFGSAVSIKAPVMGKTGRKPTYLTGFYGTLNFTSPEILQGLPYLADQTEVWSLGVLLYTCLCGEIPFSEPFAAINNEWKLKKKVSPECQDLIGIMLEKDPVRRGSITDVVNHPWWKIEI